MRKRSKSILVIMCLAAPLLAYQIALTPADRMLWVIAYFYPLPHDLEMSLASHPAFNVLPADLHVKLAKVGSHAVLERTSDAFANASRMMITEENGVRVNSTLGLIYILDRDSGEWYYVGLVHWKLPTERVYRWALSTKGAEVAPFAAVYSFIFGSAGSPG